MNIILDKDIMPKRKLKPYSSLSHKQQCRRLKAQRLEEFRNCNMTFSEQKYPVEFGERSTSADNEANDINDPYIVNAGDREYQTNEEILGNISQRDSIEIDQLADEKDDEEFWEKLNLYSDDDDGEEDKPELTLWDKVASWALRHHQNRSSINEILAVLREAGHEELPKDSRTLLGTPQRSSNIVPCGSGTYLHYGIERSLTDVLREMPENSISDQIRIDINIDGLPLSKSSKSQIWPILGKIVRVKKVFVIGCYHGYEKPKDMDDLLRFFNEEYQDLQEKGFSFSGKIYTVKINCIVCDSPARSMVTCTKSHNAYFGCPRCVDEGDYINNRMCFLSTTSPLRSNSSFLLQSNEEHHTGTSPLQKLDINMITQIPLEPMHLRDLGALKKILKLLMTFTKKAANLNAAAIDYMSEILLSLKSWIPNEFARKPRALNELDRWKATECLMFLYYLGPLVLNEVLSKEYALHFNALHASFFILSHPTHYREYNDCAHNLLKWFVETFKHLYGKSQLVFTIHCIQHLSEQVLVTGPLDQTSAYPFENYMQVLKKMIRKQTHVLAQLFRRLVELSQNKSTTRLLEDRPKNYRQFMKPYTSEKLPFGCTNAYQELHYDGFKLSTMKPDNCCYLRNGCVVFIEHIAHRKHKPVIVGKQFTKLSSFPNYPGDSQMLQLHVSKGFSETNVFPVDEIIQKAVVLPLKDHFYIFPLLHTSK